MKSTLRVLAVTLFLSFSALAQNPEPKFIADTLVVQADGTYEADPDLATMDFRVSQRNEKKAYDNYASSRNASVSAKEKTLKKEDIVIGV